MRALIWSSAAGLSIFVAVVATQGVGATGFDPAGQQVSEYVHTSVGALMVAGFLAWAGSLLAFAVATVALARFEEPSWPAHLQGAALLCAALGVVLLACFPTDRGVEVPGEITHATSAGGVHDLAAGLATFSILVAAVAGSIRSRGSLQAVTLGLLAAAIAASVALLAIGDPVPGIRQRLLLGAGCLWQAVLLWTSYRALRPATSPRSSVDSRGSTS